MNFIRPTPIPPAIILFIVLIIGYIITKLNIVKGDDSLVLSKISLYVLLPAGIINAFNTEFTSSIKMGLLLAFLAAIIIHLIFYLKVRTCLREDN